MANVHPMYMPIRRILMNKVREELYTQRTLETKGNTPLPKAKIKASEVDWCGKGSWIRYENADIDTYRNNFEKIDWKKSQEKDDEREDKQNNSKEKKSTRKR